MKCGYRPLTALRRDYGKAAFLKLGRGVRCAMKPIHFNGLRRARAVCCCVEQSTSAAEQLALTPRSKFNSFAHSLWSFALNTGNELTVCTSCMNVCLLCFNVLFLQVIVAIACPSVGSQVPPC